MSLIRFLMGKYYTKETFEKHRKEVNKKWDRLMKKDKKGDKK